MSNDKLTYQEKGTGTGLVIFALVWIYALLEWGLLKGIIFGWLPAAIAGFVCGVIWPIIVAIIVLYVLAIMFSF